MPEKTLWDWPFENKWKASLISILYGPAAHAFFELYSYYQGRDFNPSRSSTEELYYFTAAMGYISNVWYLDLLKDIKKPRIKNSFLMTLGSMQDVIGNLTNNAELAKKGRLLSARVSNRFNLEESTCIEAEYQLRKRNYPEAMEKYTKFLDTRKTIERRLYHQIGDPISRQIIKLKSKIRGSEQDLLDEAFVDLPHEKELFEKTWPKILKKYPHLEFQIIHAMFLSIYKRPEAITAWETIEAKLQNKRKITLSRNEVYECDINHFRQVIIIKKGKNLDNEWKNLKAIEEHTKTRITPRALTFFTKDNKQVLILKRNQGKDLEAYCKENISDKEKENVAQKALLNLSIIHTLNIPSLSTYNPITEIERRFISRFGYTRNAELFLQRYQEFHERRTQLEKLVTSHGDFYPSNILQDGTIIDPEKMCLANPWLDKTTFELAPQWENLDKKNITNTYPVDPIGQEFYTIHTSLCQTGSFSKKAPNISKYYKDLALKNIATLQEHGLKERLKKYLQI